MSIPFRIEPFLKFLQAVKKATKFKKYVLEVAWMETQVPKFFFENHMEFFNKKQNFSCAFFFLLNLTFSREDKLSVWWKMKVFDAGCKRVAQLMHAVLLQIRLHHLKANFSVSKSWFLFGKVKVVFSLPLSIPFSMKQPWSYFTIKVLWISFFLPVYLSHD